MKPFRVLLKIRIFPLIFRKNNRYFHMTYKTIKLFISTFFLFQILKHNWFSYNIQNQDCVFLSVIYHTNHKFRNKNNQSLTRATLAQQSKTFSNKNTQHLERSIRPNNATLKIGHPHKISVKITQKHSARRGRVILIVISDKYEWPCFTSPCTTRNDDRHKKVSTEMVMTR